MKAWPGQSSFYSQGPCLRLSYGTETVSQQLLLQMVRMEIDCNLKKLGQLFHVLMLCLQNSPKESNPVDSLIFSFLNPSPVGLLSCEVLACQLFQRLRKHLASLVCLQKPVKQHFAGHLLEAVDYNNFISR